MFDQKQQSKSRVHKRGLVLGAMAEPTKTVRDSIAFGADELRLLSMRHDARLQDELRKFCATHSAGDGADINTCLDAEQIRPLWQLAIIAIIVNKGIVMMTDNKDYEGVLLSYDTQDAPPALTGSVAPDPAQSPYDFVVSDVTPCSDDCSNFERELEKLTLT